MKLGPLDILVWSSWRRWTEVLGGDPFLPPHPSNLVQAGIADHGVEEGSERTGIVQRSPPGPEAGECRLDRTFRVAGSPEDPLGEGSQGAPKGVNQLLQGFWIVILQTPDNANIRGSKNLPIPLRHRLPPSRGGAPRTVDAPYDLSIVQVLHTPFTTARMIYTNPTRGLVGPGGSYV